MELASASPDLTKLQPLLQYMAASLPTMRVSQGWTPDLEIYFPVVRLQPSAGGQAIDFRMTRELWDHTATFEELRAAMEAAHWIAEIGHATVDGRLATTLGESGWLVMRSAGRR